MTFCSFNWHWHQCHIRPAASTMSILHFLGQDDENDMLHDIFGHVKPLGPTLALCDGHSATRLFCNLMLLVLTYVPHEAINISGTIAIHRCNIMPLVMLRLNSCVNINKCLLLTINNLYTIYQVQELNSK